MKMALKNQRTSSAKNELVANELLKKDIKKYSLLMGIKEKKHLEHT